ncbi:AraC family transcriptional regulator [uncultured Lactobacillus sp.]|uniref:helix-turn-helix domain-containing protein n=1 Tax=uncultured Lactobacillus sp. TaxID=153152 RepID=UPI00338F9C66
MQEKNSNQSPEQFIIDYRLKRASELLKSDSGTISYIALSSGFQRYQSFNRLFRKRYQISPTEFRKKYNTKTNKR